MTISPDQIVYWQWGVLVVLGLAVRIRREDIGPELQPAV